MSKKSPVHLSRRERQIMDVIYRSGEATVAQVLEQIPDPPSYSSIRAILGLLVEKGHLRFRREGMRYVYRPTLPQDKARKTALDHLLDTFFGGSTERAVAALLDMKASELTQDELDQLAQLIDNTRKGGR